MKKDGVKSVFSIALIQHFFTLADARVSALVFAAVIVGNF